jgi:ABC-2 type transport system ATP-binding protein
LRAGLLKKRIGEVLELVSLEEKADQPVHTYSGGMKRRANLAVGLLHQPQLLFLDEPTVGIDAQSRNMILEKLVSLRGDGTTMVYTTHYMEEAQQLCNRVAIIDEGEVVAEGSPAVLIENRQGCTNLGELFLALTGKDLRE